MRHLTTTAAVCVAMLLASPAALATTEFSFAGLLADGPLAGAAFSGSYSVDLGSLIPGASTELPLLSFSMQLGSATYTLADADFAPTAVFALGDFVGLSFVDATPVNLLLRPQIAFVPGFDLFVESYLAYVTLPDLGGVNSGFGNYSVAVIPEPATMALLLAGLLGVGVATRRRLG